MRQNGAFDDDAFHLFLKENGNTYLLSNDRVSWMPGRQSGRNTPRFIFKQNNPTGKRNFNFDTVAEKKYTDWISSCCDEFMIESSTFTMISQIILEELVKSGLVVTIQVAPDYIVYGLDKDRVYITDKVTQLKCDTCGIGHAVSEENKDLWIDAPCMRSVCNGSFEAEETDELDYYGKLFASGDIARINAKEHTGLLERDDREALEVDFKRSKDG